MTTAHLLKLVKAQGGRQQFYPTPQKVVCPNLQDRADKLSERSANALRNIERNQWQTTYDLNNTGLGPYNPMKLDNLDEKRRVMDTYGVEDDKLVIFFREISIKSIISVIYIFFKIVFLFR